MLQTAPVQLVHRLFPNIIQTIITTPIAAPIFEYSCENQNVVTWDKKRESVWSCASRIRRTPYCQMRKSVVIASHRSVRSRILAKLLGQTTIFYRENHPLARVQVPRVFALPEHARLGLPLEFLGVDREAILGARPHLPVANQSGEKIYDITVAPGSVWETKRWPYFRELIELLSKDFSIAVVGSKNDKSLCHASASGFKNVANFAGETSLLEMASIIQKSRLLVANDSAPIHCASALDVPTLAIFGSTTSAMGFGPLAKGSRILENMDLHCRPCGLHGHRACPLGHFKCMRTITSEYVASQVRELLL